LQIATPGDLTIYEGRGALLCDPGAHRAHISRGEHRVHRRQPGALGPRLPGAGYRSVWYSPPHDRGDVKGPGASDPRSAPGLGKALVRYPGTPGLSAVSAARG